MSHDRNQQLQTKGLSMTRKATSILFGGISAVFLTATLAATAWAGSIYGTVTDALTGAPLAGAQVHAISSTGAVFSAAAQANGAFAIHGLPLGVYTVSAGHEAGEAGEPHEEGETEIAVVDDKPSEIKLEKVSITTSRRPEKLIEAPASIAVLEGAQLRRQPAVSAHERYRHLPGLDVAASGIVSGTAVARGFNNVFSGSLLTLVDNRIARVPSLRVNAHSFISATDDDIERIEVVLGPGSALYGPNSANGVLHLITRSPFNSQGTEINVGGGERSLLTGSLRHAGAVNEQLGYKISAEYYQGDDWEYIDPEEERLRAALLAAESEGRVLTENEKRIGNRDYTVDKIGADARVDYRLSDSASAILSGGFTQSSSIVLTGLGASQAADWTYSYLQGRLAAGNLFAQAFVNMSDAGESFLLRDGQIVVDKSRLYVAQVQHNTQLGERQMFTYGVDGLFTRPDTGGTINGIYEDDDNINEVGAYLQSETALSEQIKLVAAARLDDHNRLEDMIFSPRAALVYTPANTSNFRLTYNRAYSTPSNYNLFLDISASPDPFGLGPAFEPALGFSPAIGVRASGVPADGYTFMRSENGDPLFRSPFAPLAGLTAEDYIPLHDPGFTNVMWTVGRGAVMAELTPLFTQLLAAQGLSPAEIEALIGAFDQVVPTQVEGVRHNLMRLDPNANQAAGEPPFNPVGDAYDVDPIESTVTQTYEVGYKGALFNKLVAAVDVYHSRIKNFIGPTIVETPNVFLDPETLAASFGAQLAQNLGAAPATLNQVLLALDDNEDGSAIEEITTLFVTNAAGIPYGTVTPGEAIDPVAIISTYRNYGDISLTGADLTLAYYLNEYLNVGGTYSFVSENLFELEEDPHDVLLNAPKHKFGAHVQYTNPELGNLSAQLRLRYVDTFPINSGVYDGIIEQYQTLDLTAGYNILSGTRLSLSVQNLLNDEHAEFIGSPELGRLAILRLSQSFK